MISPQCSVCALLLRRLCSFLLYLFLSVFLFSICSPIIPFPLVLWYCLFLIFLFFHSCALPFYSVLMLAFFISLCLQVSPLVLFSTLLTSCCLWANLLPTHHLVSLFYLFSFLPTPSQLFSTMKVSHGLWGKHLAHAGSHSSLFWMPFCYKQKSTKSFLKANTA